MFKIESGIPIPKTALTTLAETLRRMKPDQSVRVPKKRYPALTAGVEAHRVLGKGCYAVRSNGKFVRVWRTK